MFGIPLPWLLFGLSIALFGTYRGGYHFGWADRDKEMQIEIARKNDEAREIERNMTEKLNTTASKLLEVNNVVNEKQSALDRAIRAGRVRLPSSCVQTSASTTASGGNSQAGADADAETLRLIAQIAADGDRAINQLNACIDAYEQVRSTINGQR